MSAAGASAERPAGVEGRFTLNGFKFESGQTIDQLHVGYVMYGQLNASHDNLLLVLPGTGNTRLSAIEHVGPGRAYDTNHYCVVCTDSIGGGTSSQPADGLGGGFPRYSIRDMVAAQIAFVRDGLSMGSAPVAVLAGASMGAFQTLEWIVNFPGTVRLAVLMVPAWRSGNILRLTTARMFEIIALDSRWRDGRYVEQPVAGLRAAGRHYFPWTVCDDYLATTDHALLESEAAASGDWFAQWDAWNITRRYQASTAHDITVPFNGDLDRALSRVDATVLVLPCVQDRLLGVQDARELAARIGQCRYSEIDSPKGHLAWRAVPGSPQTQFVTRQVRDFLKLPPPTPSSQDSRVASSRGDG